MAAYILQQDYQDMPSTSLLHSLPLQVRLLSPLEDLDQHEPLFREPGIELSTDDPANRIMSFTKWIVTHIAPIFIVTSPVTSYADQIYSISKSRSSAGFSLDIPLIMLVASILK